VAMSEIWIGWGEEGLWCAWRGGCCGEGVLLVVAVLSGVRVSELLRVVGPGPGGGCWRGGGGVRLICTGDAFRSNKLFHVRMREWYVCDSQSTS
jgi:hypothetical protein